MPKIQKVRQLQKKTRRQDGLGLVETLVALAILGTSVVAFISGLSAGSIAVREQDGIASTQRLAQTQMEYTKSSDYIPGASIYPAIVAPPGYSISVTVSEIPGTDTEIQKITVTVSSEDTTTTILEGYKVNR